VRGRAREQRHEKHPEKTHPGFFMPDLFASAGGTHRAENEAAERSAQNNPSAAFVLQDGVAKMRTSHCSGYALGVCARIERQPFPFLR
jgi:hypothetical protein